MIHAIDVAVSQLGVFEETGHNDGVPAERYMRGDKLAWCAGFVLYCFDVSDDLDIWDDGIPSTVNDEKHYWKLRKVQTMEEWMQGLGRWMGWNVPGGPQQNDIIFFANRGRSDPGAGRHVGIVEGVQGPREGRPRGSVHTVEGNLGDAVRRAEHSLSDKRITGYGRMCVPPMLSLA